MQTMLSLKSGDVDSTSERRADTQQKFEKRCIWRSACVFVTRTARRVERCQSSSAHLSHQGGFAAGPLRQHLLGWMVLVQRGPQRPDGWLELGERERPRVRDAIQWLCVLVLLLVRLCPTLWTSSNRTRGTKRSSRQSFPTLKSQPGRKRGMCVCFHSKSAFKVRLKDNFSDDGGR